MFAVKPKIAKAHIFSDTNFFRRGEVVTMRFFLFLALAASVGAAPKVDEASLGVQYHRYHTCRDGFLGSETLRLPV